MAEYKKYTNQNTIVISSFGTMYTNDSSSTLSDENNNSIYIGFEKNNKYTGNADKCNVSTGHINATWITDVVFQKCDDNTAYCFRPYISRNTTQAERTGDIPIYVNGKNKLNITLKQKGEPDSLTVEQSVNIIVNSPTVSDIAIFTEKPTDDIQEVCRKSTRVPIVTENGKTIYRLPINSNNKITVNDPDSYTGTGIPTISIDVGQSGFIYGKTGSSWTPLGDYALTASANGSQNAYIKINK